jgi:MOSC domain-containing protein YiiM
MKMIAASLPRPPTNHDGISFVSAELNPQILRTVNQTHDNKAGVYGAVLVEGIIRRGDVIDLA